LNESLLLAGGGLHALWAAFHAAFWWLFRWREDLPHLAPVNRRVMHLLNLAVTSVFAAASFVSFTRRQELLTTPLGATVLWAIGLCWAVRAAEQPLFFGLRSRRSLSLTVLFAATSAAYLVPALHPRP
jgi:hypothetical protein